jgi:hypothetical protein
MSTNLSRYRVVPFVARIKIAKMAKNLSNQIYMSFFLHKRREVEKRLEQNRGLEQREWQEQLGRPWLW